MRHFKLVIYRWRGLTREADENFAELEGFAVEGHPFPIEREMPPTIEDIAALGIAMPATCDCGNPECRQMYTYEISELVEGQLVPSPREAVSKYLAKPPNGFVTGPFDGQ